MRRALLCSTLLVFAACRDFNADLQKCIDEGRCVESVGADGGGTGNESNAGLTACADGVDNDGDGAADCADSDCNGSVCRPSAGDCDLAESCTAQACPADGFRPQGFSCRAANGLCDAEETCSGTSPVCPADAFLGAAKVCRPVDGGCDVEDRCDGTGPSCPADGVVAQNTQCRGSVGACDLPESCNGSDPLCPPDLTSCQANEYCVGTTCVPRKTQGQACTTDVECTTGHCSDDVCCDTACSGSCDVCNHPSSNGVCIPTPANTVCRSAPGDCDVAEVCDGVSTSCPANAFKPNTFVCRGAVSNCDVAESCTGSAATCPTDVVEPSTKECRAAAGSCDVAESCTGTSNSCPADGFVSAGTDCGNASCPTTATFRAAPECNGSGACITPSPTSCNGYACVFAACNVSCGSDTDCAPTHYCSGTSCLQKKNDGTACTIGQECNSGNCVDGVCCNTGCGGACQTCNKSGFLGSCQNHAAGTDPESGCGAYTCNGIGACNSSCGTTTACSNTACKSGNFCNTSNAQCTGVKADGASCVNSCECGSGACTTFFQDTDGDGYGKTAVSVRVCGTAFSGYATSSGDCCDSDNRAKPGQLSFFTAPRTTCGGYDFNCDNAESRQWTAADACHTDGSCSSGFMSCDGTTGWSSTSAPNCGVSAVYVSSCQGATACNQSTCGGCETCDATTENRTQACR